MTDKRFVVTKVEVEGREETKVVEVPAFDPAPWTPNTDLHVVGQSVPRMDALEKVTGRAIYTADVRRPGMLHAAIVRSPVANGKVISVDFGPALEMPGVRDVLRREDVNDIKYDSGQLFDTNIRFAGQPLAAVCAETPQAAERAAKAVIVKLDAAPHAVTIGQAMAPNAPLVRPKGNTAKGSPRVTTRGDVDAGFKAADVIVEREYRTPTVLHTALEPHGAVAEWSGGSVTVWESTQGIFNTRADLAAAFGLKLTQVRVIKDYMGGGFGAKNGAHASTYIAVALARKTGAPVRCVWDREGEQLDAGNRSATIQRVKIGANKDGTLTAIQLDAEVALGVGGWQAGPGKIYRELHACPNVRTTETFVYTHTGAMASFRAPGHVEGAMGLECTLDAVARELDMDPLALRRKNYAKDDQEKSRPYSGKKLDECYRLGAAAFGWPTTAAAQRTTAKTVFRTEGAAVERFKRGVGMAAVSWSAGGGPPSYATVRVNPDGTVDVLTGSQDLGTGARTIFAQIAAEGLGADVADVRTTLGDTERLPFTGNSWGSQTTASVGPAVRMAAEDARARLFDAAAQLLDVPADALESRGSVIRVRDGTARTAKTREISFAAIGERLGDVMIIGQGMRGPNADNTALFTFAAHFAEVEVDVETGRVRVLRIVAAHDSGRIINPRLAESQVEGGVIQGIGYALFEERALDESLGVPLNPTMHDYKIPTLADLPVIETIFVPGSDTIANHTGAKGLAEPPIIGVAPAIANAVRNATGVEVTELPLSPWRVASALARGSAERA
jgi:xanthine dehydrogenase YagR molybdenum-binding subunit